jgi:DNA mismatch repair protein MutL
MTVSPRERHPIRVLPPGVASRIAAGEVIERPASVVKELVENALDAGALNVRIDVHGGGLSLIRVGDDGSGIPGDELLLACRRHATSKLADDDLARVQTLGFRGEALPSIAAVAELGLVSAADESGIGRRVLLRGGNVAADEPAPRPRGTTASVRNLFQTVPARLAAAARVQTEVAQIVQLIRRLALVATGVRMSLYVEERLAFQSSGSGELRSALVEVYGPAIGPSLLELGPAEVAGAHLSGIVASADVTRPERGQISLIVNGRWVQPRGLLGPLEAAYRPLLPRGRHPILALVVETAPDQVDINVHPTKLDVRLRAERAIGVAAGELLRAALGQRPRALRLTLPTGLAALGPPKIAESAGQFDDDGPIVTPGLPPLRLVGQIQDRLLLLEGPEGLYLVDQHRAHERILYERLAARHGASGPEPVALPEPLVLELRPAQVAHFVHRLDDLAAFGFHCEVFGGRTFLLRSAPELPGVLPGLADEGLAGLGEPDELAPTLLTLAGEDADDGETWRDRLLIRLSCRTAVRRGRRIERSAMRALVTGLGNTTAPAVCPHGSPLLLHLSGATLEREFDWR